MTQDRYECDYCGDNVPVGDITLREYPGYRETVTIPVCGDCEGWIEP